jgi:dCMP deaminase
MNERIGKNQYFFSIAKQVAQRSTCLRRHVGSIIVDEFDRIIATGYNGAPAKQLDCLERGYCYREMFEINSGEQYELCYAIHAEMNALIQAGILARGCNMYLYSEAPIVYNNDDCVWKVTPTYPCILCSRLILNAGINTVFIDDWDSSTWHSAEEIYNRSVREMKQRVNYSG